MKHQYKVKLFTNWFNVPTSLECEGIISYAYICAENTDELKQIVQKRFNGRKEIINIEIIK